MKTLSTLLAAACFGVMAAGAQAADTILKVAHVFPETHWLWEHAGKVFTETVEKESGGRITFQIFPAGQLGKETVKGIASGITDSGIVVTSYEASKVPLTSVLELPGLHRTACEGTAKFWNLAKEGGALYEKEYKALGLHPIYVNVLAPYQLMTSRKKIEKLEDVAGLKLRANGAAMNKTIRALGGVGVTVTSTETYDALLRGTIDGALWPMSSTITNGLEKVLSHTVRPTRLGGGSTFYAVSESVWQGLSEADRALLLAAGQKAQQQLCRFLDEEDVAVQDKMVEDGLLSVSTLPPEEAARWDAAVAKVADDWVAEMEATGRPGRAILDAYGSASTQF